MIRVLPMLMLLGCGSSFPHWAIDPIHVVPDGSTLSGTQSWQVYSKPWQKHFNAKHYLCTTLIEIQGTQSEPDCPDCLAAFDLTVDLADSDCSTALTDNETFLSLRRIGFGPLVEGGPYPGSTSVGFADYGQGWEVHGWAYVAGVSDGALEDAGPWNAIDAFELEPTFVWDLTAPAGAAMSQSARSALPLGRP